MTKATATERLLRWLLLSFCPILPLISSPLGYQYTRIIFVLTLLPLLLLLYAVVLLRQKSTSLRLAVPLPLLGGLALCGVAALSLISSHNAKIGLESLSLLLWALLLYLLVVNLTATERQFREVILALFIAGSLTALYSLVQYFGYNLFPYPQRLLTAGPGNMIATFGNKNYLASFLGPLVPLALFLLFNKEKLWQRSLIFLGLASILAAVIASGTRSVWLGLGLATVYLIIGIICGKARALLRRNAKWLAVVAVVLLLIIAIFTLPNPLNKTDIIKRVTSGAEALGDPYVRYYDWWIAWEMVRARPLIGIGLGGYKTEFFDYKAQFLRTERGSIYHDFYIPKAMQAHNEYLQTWAELGSVGLLLGLAVLGAVFYSSWRSLRAARQEAAGELKGFAGLALQGGIIVLLADAFFGFPLHLPASALELVLLAALLESGYLAPRPAFSLRWGRCSRAIFCAALLLSAAVAVTFAGRDLAAELHRQRGERLLAAGDTAQATAELEESLALAFAPKKVLFDLGLIYMDTDLPKAESLFKRALASSAADPAVYLNLAEIARAQREYGKALGYVQRGREVDPTNLEFIYLQAWLAAQMGNTQEARTLAQGLIASQDGLYRAKAYALVGDTYFLQERREEASLNYKLALFEVKEELERLQAWEGRSVTPEQHRQIMERYEELKELAAKLQEVLRKLGG